MEATPIGDALEAVRTDAGHAVRCARCGHEYGPTTRNHKLAARVEVTRVTEVPGVGDPSRYELAEEVELRRFYCPSCGVQIAADLSLPGEPVLWDVQLRTDDEQRGEH